MPPAVPLIIGAAALIIGTTANIIQGVKMAKLSAKQQAAIKEWGETEKEQVTEVTEQRIGEYGEKAELFKERQKAQAGFSGFVTAESESIQNIYERTESQIQADIQELKMQEEHAIEDIESSVELGVIGAQAAELEAKGFVVQSFLGGLTSMFSLFEGGLPKKKGVDITGGYGGGYYGPTSTGPAWSPAFT